MTVSWTLTSVAHYSSAVFNPLVKINIKRLREKPAGSKFKPWYSFSHGYKLETTYLWWKLEHGCADNEGCGMVFGSQCKRMSSCHSSQSTIGQDGLCANDHLWDRKKHLSHPEHGGWTRLPASWTLRLKAWDVRSTTSRGKGILGSGSSIKGVPREWSIIPQGRQP